MKKILIIIPVLFIGWLFPVKADEGMWLLTTLKKLNAADMASGGLEISADEIYSADKNSLKDAVVIFGGGCTGEIVSPEGLLFTNHHCGYGYIQALSSVENDYLKHGYWAMDRSEEIPVPGLSVRFIRHIEDVTSKVVKGVKEIVLESDRTDKVAENIKKLKERYEALDEYSGMNIVINDFFGGNQYILFAVEEYKDIRLVGAPPASIGKFGGETDNWMWPRHTGDFSIFRIYVDQNGKPTEYSVHNVAYKAPVHLKISLKGYEQGDFAMIMGFPGSTDRYMTSFEIAQLLDIDNPIRIKVRGARQEILQEAMASSDEIRIKYASKYASSSNYWKNSIGMSAALRRLDIRARKEVQEREFSSWAGTYKQGKYFGALPLINEAVEKRRPFVEVMHYINETILVSIDLVRLAAIEQYLSGEDIDTEEILEKVKSIYKDYDEATDRSVAGTMISILVKSLPETAVPDVLAGLDNVEGYIGQLYDNSVFSSLEKFERFIASGDYKAAADDPAVILHRSVVDKMMQNFAELRAYNEKFREGHRLYIAGLLDKDPDKTHYPDANFTIRLTYGSVEPYSPADAVFYNYYTTLSGVIEKEDPSNPDEFTVPQKLKDLYHAKDFGRYEYAGSVPVAFLTNNDITGGNSGSPVINGRGELIGLAFDGNWEALSGDIVFEPAMQRCIAVDIRYVMFIIDKFAGAGYLLNEMSIVQ